MKELNPLMRPVSKVPMNELIPGIVTTSKQSFGIVVDLGKGKKKLVNTCSKQYNLVPNSSIINPILKVFDGQDLKFNCTNKNDTRFTLDISFIDKGITLEKDMILPRLRMNNSYDGRTRYSFSMGLHRVVCSNGMTAPVENSEQTHLLMKHTPKLDAFTREDAKLIMEMVEDFNSNIKKVAKPIRELASKKVGNLEEFVMEVTKQTRFPKRQVENVLDTITKEMTLLRINQPTQWLVYNGFNSELNHNTTIRMDEHKKEIIDNRVMSYLLKH